MLRLQTVQAKDRDLLWNINQKYLYEMTCLFIGKVEAVHVDEEYLDAKGNILWDKMDLL